MRRRCYPFLLIEVFIAIVLISFCLIPLMTFPYKAAKKEREALFSLERERLLGLAFADFVKNRENLLSLDELIKTGKQEIALQTIVLELKKESEVYYPKMKVTLSKRAEKEGKFLLKCELSIKDKESCYFLLVEKK